MFRSKYLSLLLGCFLFLGFAGNALAHGFHVMVIAPTYVPPPPGHWQCVQYNQWNGSCVQTAWVQNAYEQPAYYTPPVAVPFYFHMHHHPHRLWG